MLVSVQTSGTKPPLFFIHGLFGMMTIGRFLAQQLGPDQPLYTIHVNGIRDGDTPPRHVEDMVATYSAEIQSVCPEGPLFVAGMCAGGLAAIGVARQLEASGLAVRSVILADPPTVPPGYIEENRKINPDDEAFAAQLYNRVRTRLLYHAAVEFINMPFDVNDPAQLHRATLAGAKSLSAFATHVPQPFFGASSAVISNRRAAGFFHPQMYWAKLLQRQPFVCVLPCHHGEIFRVARHDFVRALKIVLDDPAKFVSGPESEQDALVGEE